MSSYLPGAFNIIYATVGPLAAIINLPINVINPFTNYTALNVLNYSNIVKNAYFALGQNDVPLIAV